MWYEDAAPLPAAERATMRYFDGPPARARADANRALLGGARLRRAARPYVMAVVVWSAAVVVLNVSSWVSSW
jgi:hypothetical protein